MRNYTKIKIRKKASIREESLHPWIFDNEIEEVIGDYKNGDLVDVINYKDKYVGTGYINDNSKIRVRIISRNTNDVFDEDFFLRRVRYAIKYRVDTLDNLNACRLIFGEADYFSGLTIDKYNNILVSEVNSMAMDINKDMIYRHIIKVLDEYGYKIDAIYERCDSELRDKEGLKKYNGFYKMDGLSSDISSTIIEENGIKYYIDFENGQKTGFFLDQRFNRKAIWTLAKNRNVLDVCTCTGSFGLNAKMAGAKKVVSVDISSSSLEVAKKNAELNNFKDIEYIVSDAFDYLDSITKGEYDLIILDPPAFTKSRDSINNAKKGYLELNYKAMKKLNRGDYLVTCSCSHFMSENMFIDMLKEASKMAGVDIRIVESRKQAMDHPILLNVPETYYLKFFILEIV